MNRNKRSVLTAVAFAITVAAGLTGLAMSGQTRESNPNQFCAHATWPMIPAECLQGADRDRTVRTVATRTAVEGPESMAARFALAFN